MPTKIALLGAAGAMGTRATNTLSRHPAEFEVMHIETPGAGEQKLRDRGDTPVPLEEAVGQADATIMAIPDKFIGRVASQVTPLLQSGSLLMCLDPAAPFGKRIPERDDIAVFVAHPSHPPVFNDEATQEARRDYFGSGIARQSIVCALDRGNEEDYVLGERIAATLWGPILRSHRVSVEQMAMLEPALSETVAATCLTVVREAMDEAIARGVPADAARDFLLGHINVELAILFDEIEWDFSDGAKVAIEEAKKSIFQPDWRKVFDKPNLLASVASITSE
jgi:D-apionate oxidoisomerase